MTENRILEILWNLNSKSTEESIPENIKLTPNRIGIITKTLGDFIYSTNKETNVISSNKRSHIINFICNLCERDSGKHFRVSEENFEIILENILKTDNQEIEKEYLNDMKLFYMKKDRRLSEKYNKRKFIEESDENRLKDDSKEFFVAKDLPKVFTATFEEIFEKLTKVKFADFQKPNNSKSFTSDYDLIKLGLASVNLKGNKAKELVLNRISTKPDKSQDEIDFVKYLWEYLNENIVLEKCPFILEEILINFGIRVMEEERVNEKFAEENSKLIESIKGDEELKRKCLDILYELFSLCNYNGKMLCFIRFFERNL